MWVLIALFDLGPSRPLLAMVVATLSRAVAAVVPLTESSREKALFLTASMKEHRIQARLMGVYESKWGSCMSYFHWNSSQIRQLLLSYLACVARFNSLFLGSSQAIAAIYEER